MPRIKSINQANAIGTSLQDYVSVDYQTIVAKYGPPTTSDGYKIDAQCGSRCAEVGSGKLVNDRRDPRRYCVLRGLRILSNLGGDQYGDSDGHDDPIGTQRYAEKKRMWRDGYAGQSLSDL